MSSKNLKLYGKDYLDYTEMLSSGNTYFILISKRLLLRPMIPIWLFILGLFLVRSNIFFAMVGLPAIVVLTTYLVMQFPYWRACNVSPKAYIVFHTASVLMLKIISVPIVALLEVL